MPGIDLIDLGDPLLHERDDNALRLISHPEDSCPSPLGFWYLWTAKEAVFKHQRELTNFNPKSIPVEIFNVSNRIAFKSDDITGYFYSKNQVIVALAFNQSEQLDHQLLECPDHNQSEHVRNAICHYIKAKYKLDIEVIPDRNGLPLLGINNQPISFTHHYHHMAFAFDINEIEAYLNQLPNR